jgi:hypothetical protein
MEGDSKGDTNMGSPSNSQQTSIAYLSLSLSLFFLNYVKLKV